MINYKEIFEEYKESLKLYTIAQLIVVIRKEEDGTYFFDSKNLKDDLYVHGGFFPEEMILEVFEDFDFADIDKEGLWNIEALFSYYNGGYEEPSYLMMEYVVCEFQMTIEEKEKQDALVADFDEGSPLF